LPHTDSPATLDGSAPPRDLSAAELATELGSRIRAYRLARHLSQTDLALAVSQPQTSISAYERGARLPDAHQLGCLAHALGTSVGLLMGDTVTLEGDPMQVPGYHVLLGGVDVSELAPATQAEIATIVRVLVLLARARARLDLDGDPALRALPQIQNLLAGQPRNPNDRRYRPHRRRSA